MEYIYGASMGMQVLNNFKGQQNASSYNSMSQAQWQQQFDWTKQYQQAQLGIQQQQVDNQMTLGMGNLTLANKSLGVQTGLSAIAQSGGFMGASTAGWMAKAASDYSYKYNQTAIADNAANNAQYNKVLGQYETAGTSALARLTDLVSGKTDPMNTKAFQLRDKAALKSVTDAAAARGLNVSSGLLKQTADYAGQQAVNDYQTQTGMEKSIAYGGMPFAERQQRQLMSGAIDPNQSADIMNRYDSWMTQANAGLAAIARGTQTGGGGGGGGGGQTGGGEQTGDGEIPKGGEQRLKSMRYQVLANGSIRKIDAYGQVKGIIPAHVSLDSGFGADITQEMRDTITDFIKHTSFNDSRNATYVVKNFQYGDWNNTTTTAPNTGKSKVV